MNTQASAQDVYIKDRKPEPFELQQLISVFVGWALAIVESHL